jgi:dipeptidyl-peptidase-3
MQAKKLKLIFFYIAVIMTTQHIFCLEKEPETLESYKEVATQYISGLSELYNELTPAERVFVYYMYRASLPGNKIAADQRHRDSVAITDMFEHIMTHAQTLKNSHVEGLSCDIDQFLSEVKTYLIYLWTNHGQYFLKEHANEKRTPAKLNLTTLTQDNLTHILQKLDYPQAAELLDKVALSLFDTQHETTCFIANNIQASAGNIYATDFTEDDYHALSVPERTGLNSYFFIDTHNGARIPKVEKYKVDGKYGKELHVACYWLEKAAEHAKKHPEHFDANLIESLDLLITFFRTGDEEYFKKHSIAWLKSNSRLDYCFGFVETYDDPKSYVGSFQADITVKAVDMDVLNRLLPQLEKQLPFPQEFMRETIDDISAIPNASINKIIFSSGHLGPLRITAAYCLPNYSEIRSQHGSKQIMYQPDKGINEVVAPELSLILSNTPEQAAWLEQYDADGQLGKDMWAIHCILHETLGHGSGRLTTHTFKEGDLLTIGGKTYAIGDTIPVTSDNLPEFLAGNEAALEELRAEIIALYTSIEMFDALDNVGLYKDWTAKIGKDQVIKHLIFDMAGTGLRRLLSQDIEQKEIMGAHALANMVIMNYLCDSGGLQLVQEEVVVDGITHQVLGFRIANIEKVLVDIKDLMIQVQTIKSTGDGAACDKLINTYGRYVRNAEHVRILQANQKTMVGDLKVSARIYPRFVPVYDETNESIIDIAATWPADIVEQWFEFRRLEMSCD